MSTELYHHGIKGMKWGVRRFQNEDGTRTAAGKKREKAARAEDLSDEELTKRVKRMNLEQNYRKMSKGQGSKLERTKKAIDASSNLVNEVRKSAKQETRYKKMDLSNMTDQELRDRINRANLEQQYQRLFAEPEVTSKGQRYLESILDGAGTALAITGSALGVALAIKELRQKVS